jgi:thioredoxin-like negative regulator of GroEL
MSLISSIVEITAESFGVRVLDSELPVLVAVCAEGCAASGRLLALLEQWAPKTAGRIRVVRVRATDVPELRRHGGITSAPGLVLFNRGAVSYQFLGELSRSELDDLLSQLPQART